MAIEKVRAFLEEKGLADRLIEPERSSATVTEAAAAIGCEPGEIAKSLSFMVDEQPILIIAEGMARVDNKKFKERFACKAKMIAADQVEALIGHDVGGVCPFGINEGVSVYLDESLKQHEIIYPAGGNDHSAVKLSIAELEDCSGYKDWVDVCK